VGVGSPETWLARGAAGFKRPIAAADSAKLAPSVAPPSAPAWPTDEDDQDGHFFFNHPERGDYPDACSVRFNEWKCVS